MQEVDLEDKYKTLSFMLIIQLCLDNWTNRSNPRVDRVRNEDTSTVKLITYS